MREKPKHTHPNWLYFLFILGRITERGLRVEIFYEIRSNRGTDHERNFMFFPKRLLMTIGELWEDIFRVSVYCATTPQYCSNYDVY